VGPATPALETATAPDDHHTEDDETPSVTLQGRLGRDPWFRGGDAPLAAFSRKDEAMK